MIRKITCPALCPQETPYLKTRIHDSEHTRDFFEVIWSRDDELWSMKMTQECHRFHTSRQLGLFANTTGQEVWHSISMIHVQLDDTAMAADQLRL